jgi:hypothetical protein
MQERVYKYFVINLNSEYYEYKILSYFGNCWVHLFVS